MSPDNPDSADERPGALLAALTGPDSTARRHAACRLPDRGREDAPEDLDFFDRHRVALRREWAVTPRDGVHVEALMHVLRTDRSLLTIQAAAMALALEGEEGIAGLFTLLHSDDFTLRDKAALGFCVLDSQAQWAVPGLLHALRDHASSPLVWPHLIRALGRIGGDEARGALERLYEAHRAASQPGDSYLEALEAALVMARLQG